MSLKEKQKCHVTNKSVMLHGFEKNKSVMLQTRVMLHGFEKNKSVMLHEFERKTKVSCYMVWKEKKNCHVTWI